MDAEEKKNKNMKTTSKQKALGYYCMHLSVSWNKTPTSLNTKSYTQVQPKIPLSYLNL